MEQADKQMQQNSTESTEQINVTGEQQAQLTPNQLKKLKQKQKKQQQKEEQAKQTLVENAIEQNPEEKEEDKEITFEQELQWCIKQLKLGQVQNQLDKEQLQESNKVINKLESDKTNYAAKRHLMRVIFGDYRKLMKTMK